MEKKKEVKKKVGKEKVTEVFDVEDSKGNVKKEIVKHSEISEESASKEQIKKQNDQLKIILIVLAGLIAFIILALVALKMIRTVYYENVKFEIVQEGELIFYNTKIPLYNEYDEKYADYNFYLRTNPKDLKQIPFEGELDLKKGYTINLTKEFGCSGYGAIAFANLMKQYEVSGITFINDKNASCDNLNRYVYYEIKEGNETKIVQRANSTCYDVYVKECEIIPATEKLMAETFVKVK